MRLIPAILVGCLGPLAAVALYLPRLADRLFPGNRESQVHVIRGLYGRINIDYVAKLESYLDALETKIADYPELERDKYLLLLILKNSRFLKPSLYFEWNEAGFDNYKDMIVWQVIGPKDKSHTLAKTISQLDARKSLIPILESIEELLVQDEIGLELQKVIRKIYYSDVQSFQIAYLNVIDEAQLSIDIRESYFQFMKRAEVANSEFMEEIREDSPADVPSSSLIPTRALKLIHSHRFIYYPLVKIIWAYLQKNPQEIPLHPQGLDSFHHLFWYTLIDHLESQAEKYENVENLTFLQMVSADLSWIKCLELDDLTVLTEVFVDNMDRHAGKYLFCGTTTADFIVSVYIIDAFDELEKCKLLEEHQVNIVGELYRKAMGLPPSSNGNESFGQAQIDVAAFIEGNWQSNGLFVKLSRIDPMFLTRKIPDERVPLLRFLCKHDQYALLKKDIDIHKTYLKFFVQDVPFDPYMRVMLETMDDGDDLLALLRSVEGFISDNAESNSQAIWSMVLRSAKRMEHFKNVWERYFYVHSDFAGLLTEDWGKLVATFEGVLKDRTTVFLRNELGEKLLDSIKGTPLVHTPPVLYKWIPFIEASFNSWTTMYFLFRNGVVNITKPLEAHMRDLLKTKFLVESDILVDGKIFIRADSEERKTIFPLVIEACDMGKIDIPDIFANLRNSLPISFDSNEEVPGMPTMKQWAKARIELLDELFKAADKAYVVGELSIDPSSPYRQKLLLCSTIQEMELIYRKAKNYKL